MIFHMFICLLQITFYEYITNSQFYQLPDWLDSSVGRALHRYLRGYEFESRSGLNNNDNDNDNNNNNEIFIFTLK